MSAEKRFVRLAGIVVLALAVISGCSLFSRSPAERDAWYIQLNVRTAGARGIGVEEFDVTDLSIAVYGPGDQLLETVAWQASEGPRSYLIPVAEAGTHRLEVTHIGTNGGQTVEATESADFMIQAMVITVINITPGCIGVIDVEGGEPQEPIDLSGYWDFYWTIGAQPELGPVLFCLEQTGAEVLATRGFSGILDGNSLALEAWIDLGYGPLYVGLEGTVSGSTATGYEINGTSTGDMGEGTFRMIRPSTAPFGHLELEGQIDGAAISLDTEFALGGDGVEYDSEYDWTGFSVLYLDCHVDIALWFGVRGATIEVGRSYDMPYNANLDMRALPELDEAHLDAPGMLTITYYDGARMSGTFETSDGAAGGDTLAGSFDVSFWEQWSPPTEPTQPADPTPPVLSVPPVDLSKAYGFFPFGAENSPGSGEIGLIGYFFHDGAVQVRASAPGIVMEITEQDTDVYRISTSPGNNSIWRVEYNGVVNVTVSEGDSVSAGDILGTIAPPIWGPAYWTHLVVKQTDTDGDGLAYCPLSYATQNFIDQHEAVWSGWCLADTAPPPD
jgi:hypothetical protein